MTLPFRFRRNPLSLLVLSLAVCAIASFASPALAQPAPTTAPAPAGGGSPSICTEDRDPKEGAGQCKGEGQICDTSSGTGRCVYGLTNPLGTNSIPVLVGRVVTIFTGVSGSIALLMFVYGGVLWIFSGGEAERVQKGKEVMKWAVIGLFIMFSAYALVTLVFKGFGI